MNESWWFRLKWRTKNWKKNNGETKRVHESNGSLYFACIAPNSIWLRRKRETETQRHRETETHTERVREKLHNYMSMSRNETFSWWGRVVDTAPPTMLNVQVHNYMHSTVRHRPVNTSASQGPHENAIDRRYKNLILIIVCLEFNDPTMHGHEHWTIEIIDSFVLSRTHIMSSLFRFRFPIAVTWSSLARSRARTNASPLRQWITRIVRSHVYDYYYLRIDDNWRDQEIHKYKLLCVRRRAQVAYRINMRCKIAANNHHVRRTI